MAKPGPKPSGELIWRKSGWRARIRTVVDGERIRRVVDLGTSNRAVARRKLARLLTEEHATVEAVDEAAGRSLTLAEFAEQWLIERAERGIRIAPDERRWFERFWLEALGSSPLTAIRSGDVRDVLVACATGKVLTARGERLKYDSIQQVRGVLLRILDAAWQTEIISENPVARVKLNTIASRDVKKPRTEPTGEEFAAMLAHPDVEPEIKILALLSATVGGARAGDLNKLDVRDFGEGFATVRIARSKSKTPQLLEVHPDVRPFLAVWHQLIGSPPAGPFFPVRKGATAGEFKSMRSSSGYAVRFRRALRVALGLRYRGTENRWREKPAATYTERERQLLFDTQWTRPADFHTCRRMFCSMLARAGVNVQTAQILAGHSDPKVHQRYVDQHNTRALPAAVELPPVLPLWATALPNRASCVPGLPKGREARRERRRLISATSAVDLRGIEPLTSALRTRRSPS
jgi:integrase